jgi:hypothetical protein
LKLDDQLYVNGIEDVAQRVRRRSQYLTGRFGHPLGEFFKVALDRRHRLERLRRQLDARHALAAQNAATGRPFFRPPLQSRGVIPARSNSSSTGWAIRSPPRAPRPGDPNGTLGAFDNATAAFLEPAFGPDQQSFRTWRLTAFKEWYLPKFQKLKAELTYLDGDNLDRFSQYRFGRFGAESLAGYAGTGLRFDTGYIARTVGRSTSSTRFASTHRSSSDAPKIDFRITAPAITWALDCRSTSSARGRRSGRAATDAP